MNWNYLKCSFSTKSSNKATASDFDIRSNSIPTFNKDSEQTNPNYKYENMTNQGAYLQKYRNVI